MMPTLNQEPQTRSTITDSPAVLRELAQRYQVCRTRRFSPIKRFILSLSLAMGLLAARSLSAQETGLTEDERNTIEVFQQASRGVVHIRVGLAKESKFDNQVKQGGTGTGFVIDREGYILTAFHVVENMNQIEVVLSNGRRLNPRLVGTAPQLDVALLQIQAPADELFPLSLGDSASLQVGQKAIAIGNPLGLHNTISVGVVSALRRTVGETAIELEDALIQTDAAINPGSSGGPLLNSAGKVVGINTAIIEHAQNVGFAIPINFVRRVIPDLIEMGHPYRPQLGFSTSEITPNIAKLFGLSLEKGLIVEEVLPGSPAARAGLRTGDRVVMVTDRPYVLGGDIIVAVNGQGVTTSSQLAQILLQSQPGEVVRLGVYRNGQNVEISIRLQSMQMKF